MYVDILRNIIYNYIAYFNGIELDCMSIEDKRIKKTKRNLRDTLIKMLKERPFEQITVTELCKEAETSRITFYAHYNDKYELVDDVYNDMMKLVIENYWVIEKENNKEGNPVESFCNLLESIILVCEKNLDLFMLVTSEENPYLYFSLYQYLQKNIEMSILLNEKNLSPKYNIKDISAFICSGMSGFISRQYRAKVPPEKVRKDARKLLKDMFEAEILMDLKK